MRYDNYKFLTGNTWDITYRTTEGSEFTKRYGTDTDLKAAKGLLTGTVDVPGKIHSAFYYDYQGRMIQSQATNIRNPGYDRTYFSYNFTGQPVKEIVEQSIYGVW